MRIAIITPCYFPSVRGNSVTVARIAHHLRQLGHDVQVFPLDRSVRPDQSAAAVACAPDLMHAFHAYQTAAATDAFAQRCRAPIVLTVTGTDINHDLGDPSRSAETLRALRRASAVVAFQQSLRARIAQAAGRPNDSLFVIPQAAWLPDSSFDARTHFGHAASDIVFVVAGGIRDVKNPCFAIEPLQLLHARMPRVRLVWAGPILEASLGDRVLAAALRFPWASYVGVIPHEDMRGLLRSADVVVNSSLSESMPNTLIEAMAAGTAVLASDIEGNRAAVRDGVDGLLYTDAEDFTCKAQLLASDAARRRALGDAGRARAADEFRPEREAAAYVQVYERVLASR